MTDLLFDSQSASAYLVPHFKRSAKNMFGEIKTVVDLIKAAFDGFARLQKKKDEETILDFLKFYFLLSDVADEGEQLLSEVGANPEQTLDSIAQERLEEVAMTWDSIIKRQASRLYEIAGWIGQTPSLKIIKPGLSEELLDFIGAKGERVNSLSTIGSSLVITSMFGIQDRETRIELIKSMYREDKEGLLSVSDAQNEITEMRVSLEEFRKLCLEYIGGDAILRLSSKARELTQIELA